MSIQYYVNYVWCGSPRCHPESKSVTSCHWHIGLLHIMIVEVLKVMQELAENPPSHSHDSWAQYSAATASHSLGEQSKWFQWSWYLRAERARQAVHFQLLHYPLRPVLSAETLKASLMGIDNGDQTASHQTKPPLNKLSSQAVKSEAGKQCKQSYPVGHNEAEL